jgi:hypothetical protein
VGVLLQSYYQNLATLMGSIVWGFISAGVTIALTFIYVLKPFGTNCGAKEWEALINDKLGGSFPKMWLFWILLAAERQGPKADQACPAIYPGVG